MEKVVNRLKTIVEEILNEDSSLFLVDILVKGGVGNQKLLIIIDGDDGVNIDHCSMISRKVGAYLEEEDLMEGKFFLEVSSPGLDHPIKLKRQYKKNIGRHLEVETRDGEKVKGKLVDVTDDLITLKEIKDLNGEKQMSFKEINQSKIEVSFK